MVVILAIVLLIVVVAGVGWFVSSKDSFFDNSALTGQMPGKTQQQIVDELNMIVEKGMFNISINTQIDFETADSKGRACIENVPANLYDMKVRIKVDETDKTIYESGAIKPGQYIEMIQLTQELEEGEYPATAIFTAYDKESHSEIGEAAAQINIKIGAK